MAADFLLGLVSANLAASAAIVLVLILRDPVRRIAGARLAYWLWLTPVAAGIAVLLPALPANAPVAVTLRPVMQGALDTAAAWAVPAVPGLACTAGTAISGYHAAAPSNC